MKKYYVISCNVLWRELSFLASQTQNSYFFHFLKQGLHNTPDILRAEAQKAIDQIPEEYSACLMGYGLCGKGIEGLVARNHPLVFMRGHDCITFLLGSKEKYREYFDNNPGTYWYSSGWIETSIMPGKERCDILKKSYLEKFGEEMAEYLMETEQVWLKQYSNAAYIDMGIGSIPDYYDYTKQSARWLGWRYDYIKGERALMQNFLNGNWDEKDFLVVNPGEMVTASADERILIAKPAPNK